MLDGGRLRSSLVRRCVELASIVGILLYFLLSKSLPDIPLCPSYYFGYRCPTCGTTRSLWNILHGNFATAWSFNPIGYVVLLVLCRRILVLSSSSRSLNRLLEHRWMDLGLLGGFLAFGFLREIGVV
jgi:hypothetical protein